MIGPPYSPYSVRTNPSLQPTLPSAFGQSIPKVPSQPPPSPHMAISKRKTHHKSRLGKSAFSLLDLGRNTLVAIAPAPSFCQPSPQAVVSILFSYQTFPNGGVC